mmetsp:Transcript_104538/g.320193  ORF Transcript_104538/g.320193 Transcript_104538/m.320193 type:complete len:266 (-) Transcript_104538:876-1673(-)
MVIADVIEDDDCTERQHGDAERVDSRHRGGVRVKLPQVHHQTADLKLDSVEQTPRETHGDSVLNDKDPPLGVVPNRIQAGGALEVHQVQLQPRQIRNDIHRRDAQAGKHRGEAQKHRGTRARDDVEGARQAAPVAPIDDDAVIHHGPVPVGLVMLPQIVRLQGLEAPQDQEADVLHEQIRQRQRPHIIFRHLGEGVPHLQHVRLLAVGTHLRADDVRDAEEHEQHGEGQARADQAGEGIGGEEWQSQDLRANVDHGEGADVRQQS